MNCIQSQSSNGRRMSQSPRAAVFDHLQSAPKTIAVVAGIFVLSSCGSSNYVTPTAQPSSSSQAVSTVASAPCVDWKSRKTQNADEKYLTAEIAKLSFPSGTCLFTVYTTDRSENPGKISVTVSLDVAASAGPDDLRPVATDIARLLKKTAIASRISVVDITNQGTAKPKYRTLLTDENFQDHPWNGAAPAEAEMAIWKIVDP